MLPDPGFMGALLSTWVTNPDLIDPSAVSHYTEAMRIPYAPDKAARVLRWTTRPLLTAAHARFVASARVASPVPVLQLQADSDSVLRWRSCRAGGLGGDDYRFELLSGLGHLPAEEDGEQVSGLILDWLRSRQLMP
jgi:pimeloyl-ACP methyl ester carboxylesterase